MRSFTPVESITILLLTLGMFTMGIYVGNHNAEQNLYAMFDTLENQATHGNVDALTASDALIHLKPSLDRSLTSHYLYWVIETYRHDRMEHAHAGAQPQ